MKEVFILWVFLVLILSAVFHWTMIIHTMNHPMLDNAILLHKQKIFLVKMLILECIRTFIIAWYYLKFIKNSA